MTYCGFIYLELSLYFSELSMLSKRITSWDLKTKSQTLVP